MFKRFFSKDINIPTLRLSGVIGQAGIARSGLTIRGIEKLIDKLFADKKSPAVALIINSPGGSPTQSSLIAEKIINLSKEKNKKVYAFVEDVAASGGYWLACAADEIYLDLNSIVGSIGVISPGFGFVDLIKKIGIERRVYTSGKSKSFLDPFKEEKKEDIDRLKNIQEQIHENFIEYVKKRRGSKLLSSSEDESRFCKKDFFCSIILILAFFPNFSLIISLIEPIPSANPSSTPFFPTQNNPEIISSYEELNRFEPLLFFTYSIKFS